MVHGPMMKISMSEKIENVHTHGVKKKVRIPTPAIMKCTAEISRRKRARRLLIAQNAFPEAQYSENHVRIPQNSLYLKVLARRGALRAPRRRIFREGHAMSTPSQTRPSDMTPAGQHSLPGAKNSKSSAALGDRGVEGVAIFSPFCTYMVKIE